MCQPCAIRVPSVCQQLREGRKSWVDLRVWAEPSQNRQQGKGLAWLEYLQADDPAIREKEKKLLAAELVAKLTGGEA